MNLSSTHTDEAILQELGRRIARQRLEAGLTQEELAHQAGIGKRTLGRIEAGQSAQLASWIRVLRALDLLEALDAALPEPRPSPLDLLEHRGKPRQRVRKRKKTPATPPDTGEWQWGDES